MTDRHDKKRATMAANIEATTGKTVEQWVDEVEAAGPDEFMAAVAWLKERHGLGHFQARLVAEARRDRQS